MQITVDRRNDVARAISALTGDATAPALDEEFGEVSRTLFSTMARLHDISERARTYEEEVRRLVERGEDARVTAELNEDAVRRIARILGTESQARLTEEIDRLPLAHATQIGALKKSGNRTALITFVGGALRRRGPPGPRPPRGGGGGGRSAAGRRRR